MKKYIVLIIVLAVIIAAVGFYSFRGKSNREKLHVIQPNDSSIVLCKAVSPGNLSSVDDWLLRITKDTLRLVVKDSSDKEVRQKKEWTQTKDYYYLTVDTLKETTGRYKLDSLGNITIQKVWNYIPNEFIVIDYNVKLNDMSALAQAILKKK